MSSQYPLSSSSSSSGSSIPSVVATNSQEIGKALAEAIKGETSRPLSKPMRADIRKKAVENLLDEAPSRTKLRFDSLPSDNPKFNNITKATRGPDIGDADNIKEIENLFCMGHGDFALVSATSVEHGTPYATICENIENFLEFLNDKKNEKITDEFLKRSGINDFFRRDLTDKDEIKKGKVKATEYLYKVSYSQVSNLWLLCQACNNEKGDKPTLEWFKNQKYFGQEFINDIDKVGGLCKGIIFEVVPNSNTKILPVNKGFNVCIGAVGIGEYAHSWFMKKKKDLYENFKHYYMGPHSTFKEKVDEILELRKAGKDEEVEQENRRLTRKNKMATRVYSADFKHDSQSDSDTESQAEAVQVSTEKSAVNTNDKNHHLKGLEVSVADKYAIDSDKAQEIHQFFMGLYPKALSSGVPNEDIIELREKIETRISDSNNLPTWDDLKREIETSLQDSTEKITQLTQEKEAAEQRENAALQEAAEYKRKYEEAMAALSSSSSSNRVSSGSSSSSSGASSSSSSSVSSTTVVQKDADSVNAAGPDYAQKIHGISDALKEVQKQLPGDFSRTIIPQAEAYMQLIASNDDVQAKEQEVNLKNNSAIADNKNSKRAKID